MSQCYPLGSRLSNLLILSLCCLLLALTTHTQVASSRLRSITVVTEPNATVWIDSVRYGVTNEQGKLSMTGVPTGPRSLRVRAQGFAEVKRPLPAATQGEIQVKLVKTTDEAELAFQSGESLIGVDREKAIAEYQRAAKLRPKYPEAYIALARAYSERGEIENAFKAIQSAKRLRPGDPEVSAVEGRLLKDTGEEDKAIVVFKRAIREGRGFQPEAYTGLGLLYKDRAENVGGAGDYSAETVNYNEAAKNLAVAVKQLGGAPDAIVVYQLLGLIYERQKRYAEAIALYEQFLKIFPNTSEASAVASFITQIKKQMTEPK